MNYMRSRDCIIEQSPVIIYYKVRTNSFRRNIYYIDIYISHLKGVKIDQKYFIVTVVEPLTWLFWLVGRRPSRILLFESEKLDNNPSG